MMNFEKELIDVLTPACHASTLALTRDGNVVVAWFGGEKEGADDVDIWTRLKRDGVWQDIKHVCVEKDTAHWNPVLFRLNDGRVALCFKVGKKIAEWKTYACYSEDGENWSEPTELVAGDISGGRGPVKNKPIYLADGTVLAPASTEIGPWRPFVDITKDFVTWEKGDKIEPADDAPEGTNMIQPTLWQDDSGDVHMLLRTNKSCVFRSDSSDGGKSWCKAYPISLPNNNSGLDVASLDDGRLVLVLNPTEGDFGRRTPLSVYLSCDNGATWEEVAVLEDGEGEFSYPSIISEGNKVYITYSWKRLKVGFCTMSF